MRRRLIYSTRWPFKSFSGCIAALLGACSCGSRSAPPVPSVTALKPSNGASRPHHANQADDSDPDAVAPKSDMLVVKYFGLESSGNCILLTTTSGKHILIDAAPTGTEQDVLSHLQQSEVNTLDYVIITCPTAEHIGCLPALLGGMTHGDVLTPGLPSPLMSQVEQVVQAGGGKLQTLRAGSVMPLDDNTTLEVLAPGIGGPAPPHPTVDWYDNHSLVFRVKYNKASILFTGDMGPDERSWLYSAGAKLRSSILSGLHHGDRRIGDIEFIHAVSPVLTVLMCQIGNKSGYPHRETLDALKSTMTNVNRTDVQSDITVRVHSDGQVNASPSRPGTEEELSQSGSGLKHGLKSSGTVQMENPTDDSNSLESHDSGSLP